MEEPVLKLSNSTCINKLIQYLTYHKLQDVLDSIAKHNALSLRYDTHTGDLILTLYHSERVSAVIHLTVGEELERYKLWQYFYLPEHRNDWED